ncbi:hypothetical protein [Flavobacterium piscis]|uniref:Uncharacterized protein n=1 Tax=Flavobacterium piscis TaxID=1114874 RepID=A0ABU1YCD3_9FLAO|nr:hypothetical protein [Flavobacterium piscis]MDR7211813.1 hypothetical protein [Flavobacterium piscis]
MSTKLDQLYSLRKNFTIIGLTGRTGSGCSELAEVLSKKFDEINNIRKPSDLDESVFQRKYTIAYNYTKENWKEYKVIEYKKVLLLILLPKLYSNPSNTLLFDFFRYRLKDEAPKDKITKIKEQIQKLIINNEVLIKEIISIGNLQSLKLPSNLLKLNEIFWGEKFNNLANELNHILKDEGVIERIMLLHHTANNFRKRGRPLKEKNLIQNIFIQFRK